jgi:hypothetical protein
MSTASLLKASLPIIHRRFEATFPKIDEAICSEFRHWPRRLRAAATADTRPAAWHCWHGLLVRGRDTLAVGHSGIAFNGCWYVKTGRRLGTGSRGAAAMDVLHSRAQRRSGFRIFSIDLNSSMDAESLPKTGRAWLRQTRIRSSC